MTFLAPFFAPVLAGIRWLGAVVLPGLATGFVAHILAKLSISVITGVVIFESAEWLINFLNGQISALGGSGAAAAAALQLMSLFGVFEALSLIASAYLAKATWLMMKPSLAMIGPGQ
jgi:hypothetical protein